MPPVITCADCKPGDAITVNGSEVLAGKLFIVTDVKREYFRRCINLQDGYSFDIKLTQPITLHDAFVTIK